MIFGFYMVMIMEKAGRQAGKMGLSIKLKDIIDKAVEKNQVAGASVLVEKDGEELVYCQGGMADIENGIPISRNTIYRLYSQTKPITAAAAMILMERGELDLAQQVADFFPEYRKIKVQQADGTQAAAKQPLLVWHLLNMTSGLSYPGDDDTAGRASAAVYKEAEQRLGTPDEMSTEEFAVRMAQVPLAFEPGSSWRYGTSADIMAAIVEKISGMSFSDFLKEELFLPLGMKDTGFYVPQDKRERLAKIYETKWDLTGKAYMENYNGNHLAINNKMDHEPAYAAGGAGLVSTLDDYMKFARMLLNEGRHEDKRIMRPATVRYMTGGELQPHTQDVFRGWIGLSGYSYGNLMRVCKKPEQAAMLCSVGEYGWDGWLGMYFANFIEEKMTILMGTQKRDAGTFELTRKLRNVILANR